MRPSIQPHQAQTAGHEVGTLQHKKCVQRPMGDTTVVARNGIWRCEKKFLLSGSRSRSGLRVMPCDGRCVAPAAGSAGRMGLGLGERDELLDDARCQRWRPRIAHTRHRYRYEQIDPVHAVLPVSARDFCARMAPEDCNANPEGTVTRVKGSSRHLTPGIKIKQTKRAPWSLIPYPPGRR